MYIYLSNTVLPATLPACCLGAIYIILVFVIRRRWTVCFDGLSTSIVRLRFIRGDFIDLPHNVMVSWQTSGLGRWFDQNDCRWHTRLPDRDKSVKFFL
uniref:Uncharacterized protein n=1 Tax=Pararge aegeria TaxID=116150 RepID=S4PDS0_9NEOP